MQSAVPHVLADAGPHPRPGPGPAGRGAGPGRPGFEGVSLDLIYGTPGESQDDWRTSLAAALDAGPDHVSAYALVVEEGTRMAGQVRRGEIPAPGRRRPGRPLPAGRRGARRGRLRVVRGQQLGPRRRPARPAQRGLLARPRLVGRRAGGPQPRGRDPVVERAAPTAYAGRLAAGASPAQAREVLTDEQRRVERVLLGDPAARGAPARRPAPAAGRAARRGRSTTGCSTRPRTPTAAQR